MVRSVAKVTRLPVGAVYVADNSCVRRDVVENGRTLPGAEVEAEGAIGQDPELSVSRFVREKK